MSNDNNSSNNQSSQTQAAATQSTTQASATQSTTSTRVFANINTSSDVTMFKGHSQDVSSAGKKKG